MPPQTSWILQEETVLHLQTTIPYHISQIGTEDAQELVLDSTCFAAKLLDNAEKAKEKVPRETSPISLISVCAVGGDRMGVQPSVLWELALS